MAYEQQSFAESTAWPTKTVASNKESNGQKEQETKEKQEGQEALKQGKRYYHTFTDKELKDFWASIEKERKKHRSKNSNSLLVRRQTRQSR